MNKMKADKIKSKNDKFHAQFEERVNEKIEIDARAAERAKDSRGGSKHTKRHKKKATKAAAIEVHETLEVAEANAETQQNIAIESQ